MPQEKRLILQLHELLTYLNQRGVLTLLVTPELGFVNRIERAMSVSYIADSVILLRFFEFAGRVRKAVSIVKNRGGNHEDTIRELAISERGLCIGEVLKAFRGILTGEPVYSGDDGRLLHDGDGMDG